MNKILVFTEKKDLEGIFKGLYGPNGFQISSFGPEDEIRIEEEDHFIVVHPGRERASLSKIIGKARKQVPDLKVVLASTSKTPDFLKQFDLQDVDFHITGKTTMGEIKDKIRRLLFPEKYQGKRTENPPSVAEGRPLGGNGKQE